MPFLITHPNTANNFIISAFIIHIIDRYFYSFEARLDLVTGALIFGIIFTLQAFFKPVRVASSIFGIIAVGTSIFLLIFRDHLPIAIFSSVTVSFLWAICNFFFTDNFIPDSEDIET